jgi:hypothetical protein
MCAYKLAATYKMTLMYFIVNIRFNKRPTLYKVNNVVVRTIVVSDPIPNYNE